MEIVGAVYQYLLPSMGIAFVLFAIWKAIWILVIRLRGMIFDKDRAKIDIYSKINFVQWLWQYVFLVYLQGVMFLTDGYYVFLYGIPQYFMEPNLVPIVNTLHDIVSNPGVAIVQLVDNLIFFIPFGFLLPLAFCKQKWKLWKVTLVSLVVIGAVEGLEVLAGRYMDIDDFIINCIGSVLGYILWKGFVHRNCSINEEH